MREFTGTERKTTLQNRRRASRLSREARFTTTARKYIFERERTQRKSKTVQQGSERIKACDPWASISVTMKGAPAVRRYITRLPPTFTELHSGAAPCVPPALGSVGCIGLLGLVPVREAGEEARYKTNSGVKVCEP